MEIRGTGSVAKLEETLEIGVRSKGQLEVADGSSVQAEASYIGWAETGNGIVEVKQGASYLGTNMTVATHGQGSLHLSEGGIGRITNGWIGWGENGVGDVGIVGEGSKLEMEYNHIGVHGTGHLEVFNGAVSHTSKQLWMGWGEKGVGSAIVGNGGTLSGKELIVGNEGQAGLNVESNGNLDFEAVYAGFREKGHGTITVRGVGANYSADSTQVGVLGEGTVNVSEGAIFKSKNMIIGVHSNGSLNVIGKGTRLEAESFQGGFRGKGVTTVSGGGTLQIADLYTNHGTGSSGVFRVTGSGSKMMVSSVARIGSDVSAGEDIGGIGSVLVEDDGRFEVDGALRIFSNGSLTLDGGDLFAKRVELIGESAQFDVEDGKFSVESFGGNLNMDAGTLAPGKSPGITSVEGHFVMTGGVLEMELAGLAQGTEYDFLQVAGDVQLSGGELDIRFLDGFELGIADADLFTLIEAGGTLTGTFDGIQDGDRIETSDGKGSFEVRYTGNSVEIGNYVAAVPEPGSAGILILGMTGLAIARRRKVFG